MTEQIGAQLRRLREHRGWTQQDVARQLQELAEGELLTEDDRRTGVDLRYRTDGGTVGRWERGSQCPTPGYTRLLCKLYECSPEELGIGLPRRSMRPA